MRAAVPELVPADALAFVWECWQCACEKTRRVNGRAWGLGERRDEIRQTTELAPEADDAWVECAFGHRHHVVREGSRVARAYGIS